MHFKFLNYTRSSDHQKDLIVKNIFKNSFHRVFIYFHSVGIFASVLFLGGTRLGLTPVFVCLCGTGSSTTALSLTD